MINKEEAVRKIEDINRVMVGSFSALLSGERMMAIGAGVMAIPLIEALLSFGVDPLFVQMGLTSGLVFFVRALFYWFLFAGIARFFPVTPTRHPMIKRIFSLLRLVPLILVPMAGILAYSGYGNLISPFILIMLGFAFLIFGLFSPAIVSIISWSFIGLGFLGIYLSQFSLPQLSNSLIILQGLGFVIMGFVLRSSHQRSASSAGSDHENRA